MDVIIRNKQYLMKAMNDVLIWPEGLQTKNKQRLILRTIFKAIENALRRGERVTILNFGRFEVKSHYGKPRVKFRPADGFKLALNAVETIDGNSEPSSGEGS